MCLSFSSFITFCGVISINIRELFTKRLKRFADRSHLKKAIFTIYNVSYKQKLEKCFFFSSM